MRRRAAPRRPRAAAIRYAAPAKPLQRRAERARRAATSISRRALRAALRRSAALATVGRRDDDDRPGVECREDPRRGRRPQPPVENDARQRPFAVAPRAVSSGIVGQDRPDARRRSRRSRRAPDARGGWPRAEVSASRRPGASAMKPSRLVAAFRMTNGRPSRISVKNGWFSDAAGSAPMPDVDGDAVRRAGTRNRVR